MRGPGAGPRISTALPSSRGNRWCGKSIVYRQLERTLALAFVRGLVADRYARGGRSALVAHNDPDGARDGRTRNNYPYLDAFNGVRQSVVYLLLAMQGILISIDVG